MKLSATRLKTYLTCPRQYRYIYVEELPRVPTPALLFGSAMHETLRLVQEQRMQTNTLPLPTEAVLMFNRLWREAVCKEQPAFKVGTSIESYEVAARQMLSVHLKVSRTSLVPLLLEFPFEISVGEHTLVGILDRVDESETESESEQAEAGLVVIDYKSGQRKPSRSEVERDLQLTVYAYAVQQVFGLPVHQVICHWLRDGVDLVSTRGVGDYEWLTQELLPYVAESVQNEQFAPKPGYYCRFCDYRQLCEAEGLNTGERLQGEEPYTAELATVEMAQAAQGGAMWPMPSN